MLDSEVGVGKGLRLDALRRIDYQHRALACGKRTRHLIVEVNVTRSVDEVEDIILTVVCVIFQADGTRLDGDAALPLDIHIVEKLILHIPERDCIGELENAVSKGGFAVIYVCDNAEIAYVFLVGKVGHLHRSFQNVYFIIIAHLKWFVY